MSSVAGNMQKLNVQGIGVALGITWALGCLLIGLSALAFGYGAEFVAAVGTFYIGYAPTLLGVLIGTVWGFVDAYIGGVIFVWLYNKFTK
ncbi:bacteriophage holin [Candidatus Wolfebacteria bacterium]|nr:bacteriophage holin [Candidatus Wolfebacteria bacterium]